ncbi:MAG: hypothetical protein QM777_09595 [Pseudorhodoferax sp.]
MLDARGLLWIQTDAAADEMRRGEMQAPGQQPDAGLRPGHGRGAPLPDRAA